MFGVRSDQRNLKSVLASLIFMATSPWLVAQSPPSNQPRFEVASVKFAGNDSRLWTALKRSGGRVNWTANRMTFVLYAYPNHSSAISGIEPDDLYYTVDAIAEDCATDDQIRLMFRRLLAERFQLVVQHGDKISAIFVLMPAKNWLKLKPLQADEKPGALPSFLSKMEGHFPEGRIVSFSDNGHVLMAAALRWRNYLRGLAANSVRLSKMKREWRVNRCRHKLLVDKIFLAILPAWNPQPH